MRLILRDKKYFKNQMYNKTGETLKYPNIPSLIECLCCQ